MFSFRVTLVGFLSLLCGTAWSATLMWDENQEPDLAGYRVYQCTQQPCGRAYGTTTLFATLGRVTTLNIGTPVATRYYVVTAYDSVNNESAESNVVTVAPAGAPVLPPPPASPGPAAPPAPTGLRITAVN
jgi:fibronectin type 3 domain-containing protein